MAKVTLIKRSSPVCPGCNIMKTMLDGEGIPHEVIDITTNPEAIEQFDLTAVPVIRVVTSHDTVQFNGVTPIEVIKEAMGE
jgi:glutaredoxin